MNQIQHKQDQDGADSISANPAKVAAPRQAKPKKSPGAFRTISEVADTLNVQQHVLRFWETKFTQIRPLKRGGGRRYYRPEDVLLLQRIHHLLYTEGYTIKGVQKLLKEQGRSQLLNEMGLEAPEAAKPVAVQPVAAPPVAPVLTPPPRQGLTTRQRSILESMIGDLRDLRNMIRGG